MLCYMLYAICYLSPARYIPAAQWALHCTTGLHGYACPIPPWLSVCFVGFVGFVCLSARHGTPLSCAAGQAEGLAQEADTGPTAEDIRDYALQVLGERCTAVGISAI